MERRMERDNLTSYYKDDTYYPLRLEFQVFVSSLTLVKERYLECKRYVGEKDDNILDVVTSQIEFNHNFIFGG